MALSRIERAAGILSAAGLAAVATAAAAWCGALPGGWTLRGLAEPHAEREARERALHLAERCRAFARDARADESARVVFLGSSTIERCDLAQHFPGVPAANRGVGGARGRELAARVDELLCGADPEAIVLYAGGPDRVGAPLDVAGALGAVAELANAVRAQAPRAEILLLGLLPTTTDTPAELRALAEIDAGIARLAARMGLAHVTLRDSRLARPDGRLVEGLSTDGLHLTREGYAIFAERVRSAPEPFASLLAP
jgi:lysophospholipase L1-like esterase